jgi:hypothetical protein
MGDVFISCSPKDKEAARTLAEACENQGLEVWIDWKGIEPTGDWLKEVEKGIEGADTFLFLENLLGSQYACAVRVLRCKPELSPFSLTTPQFGLGSRRQIPRYRSV